MDVLGYSERGIINSLFYEIKFSEDNLKFLNNFLSLISFPYKQLEKINFQISNVKVLIEQSFSDFGDSDLLFLIDNVIDNVEKKQVVFIEAKVKTDQNSKWKINKEFEKFKCGIGKIKPPEGYSSNLFVQLYFKTRVIEASKTDSGEQIQKGLQFPKCLLKNSKNTDEKNITRKIGNNQVVLSALTQVKEYSKDREAFFVALVPDNISNLANFYQNTFKDYHPDGFQKWNIKNWGYLSWIQVKEFCKRHELKESLRTFSWNKGQIY